jgi:hypothetical protein
MKIPDIMKPTEILYPVEIKNSHDLGPAKIDYAAYFRDSTLSNGLLEATITPGKPGEYNTPVCDGETEEGRLEAAIAEALASEYAYYIEPLITGFVMGADTSARQYSYEIEKFIPASPEDEREMLESFDAYIPYSRDKEAPYSHYRVENKETGTEIYCFVLRVADEHVEQLGRWRVEPRIPELDDDEFDDEDDDMEAMK